MALARLRHQHSPALRYAPEIFCRRELGISHMEALTKAPLDLREGVDEMIHFHTFSEGPTTAGEWRSAAVREEPSPALAATRMPRAVNSTGGPSLVSKACAGAMTSQRRPCRAPR